MPRSRKVLLHKIRKNLSEFEPEVVIAILDRYGVESYENGRTRVQLAILKVFQELAQQNESPDVKLERLQNLVRTAKLDFRDVVAWAEYPEENRMGFREMKKLSPQQAKALRRRDRKQYLHWLAEG